jgi:adenosine/AMP kinase
MVEIKIVNVDPGLNNQLMIGQAGFIKTIEDVYEALINSSTVIKFGVAFSEASGQCLIRTEGNDTDLQEIAERNATALGSGHVFVVVFNNAYPINVNNAVKSVPEVTSIYCSTANSVQVIIAESEQGRGILGVIDGYSPKGVESPGDKEKRKKLLRDLGYKM